MDDLIPRRSGVALDSGPGGHRDLLALAFGLAAFVLHALVAGRYDVFRDELYFIVCGRHPALGYVDQPPVVPLLAAGLFALGEHVWLLRLPLALAAGALAWLAVRLARQMSGDGVAAALAGLCVTIAPMLMGMGATLNTTGFDPLLWTAIAACLAQAVRTGDPRWLWPCGGLAGLDLEIKYALVYWGVSLVVGMGLTDARRLLARKEAWGALALAAVIAAPSLVWQARHGWPFLELAAAARDKNTDIPIPAFLLNQVVVMNPLLAPVWVAGIAGPFVMARLRPYRFLSVAFVICAGLVIATHGKDYYLAAAYPVMFVLGAVTLGHALGRRGGRAILALGSAAALALSAVMAPLALPVLPLPGLRAYVRALPMKPQQQERSFQGTELPQVFADQLGWRDLTAQVRAAWAQVPASERGRTGIKVDNYGEAAALDVYGAKAGLPPALSGHNQYFLWGLRGQQPVNLLVVQDHPERLAPYCRESRVLGLTGSPDAMAYENGKAIALCLGLKVDLKTLWPQLKSYN